MDINPHQILNAIDQYVFSKDRQCKYTYANDQFAHIAGLNNPGEVVGKTDYDLVWKQQADAYNAADREVLLGEELIKQELIQYRENCSVRILMTRRPLYSPQKKIIGIVGNFFDFHNKLLLETTGKFDSNKKRLYLEFVPEWLSMQEVRVCYYLLHGFTAAKIANKIGTVESTVRFHIDNIKNKMQCKHKSGIAEVCMKTGVAWKIFSLQHINDGE